MSEIRVAINGFGQIGRSILRDTKKMNADINFVSINDLAIIMGHYEFKISE